jgi:hypothetical protein
VSTPVTQPHRRAPQSSGRKRGRGLRRLVVVFVVLAGLLVAADFGAAAFAEHTVSQKVREQLGLREDPAVTIHGFPFTTQALSGHYDHISVEASGISVQNTLRDVGLRAQLRDVEAPLSDLTAGNVDNITIGDLQGQVRLKDTDIARVEPLTRIENLRIQPPATPGEAAQDGNDRTAGVRLTGAVQIAGERIEIVCVAVIELTDHQVRIVPQRVQFGNGERTTVVPPDVQQALLPEFETTINTGGLPFTVTPTAVRVEPGALVVSGQASDVTFAGITAG